MICVMSASLKFGVMRCDGRLLGQRQSADGGQRPVPVPGGATSRWRRRRSIVYRTLVIVPVSRPTTDCGLGALTVPIAPPWLHPRSAEGALILLAGNRWLNRAQRPDLHHRRRKRATARARSRRRCPRRGVGRRTVHCHRYRVKVEVRQIEIDLLRSCHCATRSPCAVAEEDRVCSTSIARPASSRAVPLTA